MCYLFCTYIAHYNHHNYYYSSVITISEIIKESSNVSVSSAIDNPSKSAAMTEPNREEQFHDEKGNCCGDRTIGMRTIGMRTIGMEDNWHAENWHRGQLTLTFLIVSYLITSMF